MDIKSTVAIFLLCIQISYANYLYRSPWIWKYVEIFFFPGKYVDAAGVQEQINKLFNIANICLKSTVYLCRIQKKPGAYC